MDGTVLVADDDRTIRTVLTQALTRAGCKVHATSSMATLLRWVEEGRGDLVISDVVMPDGNGIEALPRIAEMRPGLPVIVISAQNNIMTAIQAAEAAAYDYLPKPFDLPDLMKRSARALETRRRRPAAAPADEATGDDLPLVGRTAAMQDLYRLVARVMNTDLSVLIIGESGTGKSLIARAIHDYSDRRALPFVIAGAGDLETAEGAAALLARAGGGTLLFDEIGDLSAEAQGRVVRLLDSLGDNPPRVMGTNQDDLSARLQEGTFRKDLFYRLGAVHITVPALRERVDDIGILIEYFLARAAREGQPLRSFSKGARAAFRAFSWPGNVRQLENTIRRLVVTSPEAEISAAEAEAALAQQPAPDNRAGAGEGLSACVERTLRRYFDLHGGALPPAGLYARVLRGLELPLIEIALEATGGNQARCAELLGINRNTLRKKITELDIRVTRRRKLM